MLGHKIRRQSNIRKHGIRAHIGLVHDTMRPQPLDLGARQQPAGPRPRGHDHVGHGVQGEDLSGRAVQVLDALDAAARDDLMAVTFAFVRMSTPASRARLAMAVVK